MPFSDNHPVAAYAGRWHVQIRRPGRQWPMAITAPMPLEQARAEARHIWRTWPAAD